MRLLAIKGPFYRAVLVDRIKDVLASPHVKGAGRYHRHDQAILYMSPERDWASIAVSGYMREDGRQRVVVPLMVGQAFVVNQRDEKACQLLGIDRELSNAPWRPALASGSEPSSWTNSDAARAADADGIVDRSRMIPGGWHLNLFRWNGLGGPSVEVCGGPEEIRLSATGPKWGL